MLYRSRDIKLIKTKNKRVVKLLETCTNFVFYSYFTSYFFGFFLNGEKEERRCISTGEPNPRKTPVFHISYIYTNDMMIAPLGDATS